MADLRLDVRLDAERRRKLEEMAAKQGSPISDVVCRLIDEAYEVGFKERRRQIVREMAELEIEDMADPETLSRQLAKTYDSSLP